MLINKVNKKDIKKEVIIHLHNDFVKNYEESRVLLENSYKLALFELYASMVENKE